MAHANEAPAIAEGPTSHTRFQDDASPSDSHGYTRAEKIEALHKLREPFPAAEIRYLPRVWCKACRDSRSRYCDDHPKRQCRTCGQKLTPAHIDLRYVGHAEATNRLLNVDPLWDWEPLATDAHGLPAYDGNRGLWIRLTVCGMTRLGYGHAGDKTGGDAVKEIIGDAIRNAGMRFGMALDLWTSSDLEKLETGEADDGASPAGQPEPQHSRPTDSQQNPAASNAELDRLLGQAQTNWANVAGLESTKTALEQAGLTDAQVQGPKGEWQPFGELLDARIAELAGATGERSAA